jgi:hypothetical protein
MSPALFIDRTLWLLLNVSARLGIWQTAVNHARKPSRDQDFPPRA